MTEKSEAGTGPGRRRSLRFITGVRICFALVLVSAVAVGGVIVTLKMADFQRDQYFAVRKYQAAAAAACLDWREVEGLKNEIMSGNTDITGTDAYKHLVTQLRQVKDSDERIRFVYVYFPVDPADPGTRYMVFLADAEDVTSKEYSPPGEKYTDAPAMEYEVFTGERLPEPIIEPRIRDVYGYWTSALASIRRLDAAGNPTGLPIALMGTDVDVNSAMSSFNQIRYVGLISDATVSILLALVLLQWILWAHNRDKRQELQMEMEDSLVRLNDELVEADSLKSEFIESASHELRGPVTAVDGALAVMERHLVGSLDDPSRQLLEIARSGSNRLVDLVNNLLDVTRIEAGGIPITTEPVNVNEIVDDTVTMFEALAEEGGLTLEAKLPREPLEMPADPEALRRVLENLVANAIKYTDRGGIVVEVEPLSDSVRFAVRDTGRGIPEKFQEEAFNKFSRLHLSTLSSERGAGLGLSICKGIVEAHGGRIWVESVEGEGSTFFFEIPREAMGPSPAPTPEPTP